MQYDQQIWYCCDLSCVHYSLHMAVCRPLGLLPQSLIFLIDGAPLAALLQFHAFFLARPLSIMLPTLVGMSLVKVVIYIHSESHLLGLFVDNNRSRRWPALHQQSTCIFAYRKLLLFEAKTGYA